MAGPQAAGLQGRTVTNQHCLFWAVRLPHVDTIHTQEQLAAAGDPGYQGAGAAAAADGPSSLAAAREAALAQAVQAAQDAEGDDQGLAAAQADAQRYLWERTDTDLVLQLLRALRTAKQPVPESLWRLVEAAVRPALRKLGPVAGGGKAEVEGGAGGGAGAVVVLGLTEPQLAALLGTMALLDHSPSRAFLEVRWESGC